MGYGLLTQESYSDSALRGVSYVWAERTVRVLVAKGDLADVLHEDILVSRQIGNPVDCKTCDNVAIDLTGYPYGLDKYGRDISVYCPHCDGGEDVG